MGGNASMARVLALGPLKTPGIYRTWQEERKNYSGEDWWKAQGIIMGMAVDEGGNEVAKTMMKDLLKTDAQKWKNKRKVKND